MGQIPDITVNRITAIARKAVSIVTLININPDADYSMKGSSKAGITVSQGNNVVLLPPEIVEKIKGAS